LTGSNPNAGVAQACSAPIAGTGANQSLISLNSVVNPRITNMTSALNQTLSGIDQGTSQEYDETLNSVLQTLQIYSMQKLASMVLTGTGSNVTVQSQQGVSVTFTGVSQAGVTVTTPTDVGAAFGVPGGFLVTPQIAFDVETTASAIPPINTCFPVPSINDAGVFASLSVYHSENGIWVDRTLSRNFATRTICAQTQSLSPFTVGIKHSSAPAVNISGQVSVTSSGLVYSRSTATFNGTVTVKNVSAQSIAGPIQVVLTNLTSGVTLMNTTGFSGGDPYVTIPGGVGIAPGQSVTVTIQFKDPANALIKFTAVCYSGGL
jgi:hypothetical protein